MNVWHNSKDNWWKIDNYYWTKKAINNSYIIQTLISIENINCLNKYEVGMNKARKKLNSWTK